MMSKSIRAPIGQECHSTTSFKCQLRLHSYILDRIRVYNIKLKNVIQYSHSMKYMSVEIHPDLCGSMHAYRRSRSTDLRRPLLPWCCGQIDFFYIYSLRNLPHRPLSPVLLMLTWSRFKAALDFEERHTSHVAYPSHEKTRISLHVSFQHDIPLLFEIYTQTNAFHGSLLADRVVPFQRVSVPFQSVFSRNSRFGSWIDRCPS